MNTETKPGDTTEQEIFSPGDMFHRDSLGADVVRSGHHVNACGEGQTIIRDLIVQARESLNNNEPELIKWALPPDGGEYWAEVWEAWYMAEENNDES